MSLEKALERSWELCRISEELRQTSQNICYDTQCLRAESEALKREAETLRNLIMNTLQSPEKLQHL